MSGKSVTLQAGRIITYILIVLLLVGGVGFVAYFTNGFTDGFKSFYVSVNGENVLDAKTDVIISPSAPLEVDVKYTFGRFSKKLTGYEVKVVPAADFTFTVDGATHSFANEEDLTGGFEIVEDDESFTLVPKGGLGFIMSGVYPDSEVVVNKSSVPKDTDLFTVIVYSKDKKASVSIGCRLEDYDTEGVTLDEEAIEF